MGYKKQKEIAEKEGKKLTGRELFMTDKTLAQSDLKFLEDGTVLFQFISFISKLVVKRSLKNNYFVRYFRRHSKSRRKLISKFG